MKILLVAGARPNFMKIAPLMRAIRVNPSAGIDCRLVHTGQHYDAGMSQTFFEELGIPEPDNNLGVGSGSHAVQTANIMVRFEEVCLKEKPDWVVVVGDVNSTAACGLVAKKLHCGLAHVEAGLRSGDRAMPEEINRMVTDAISDLLFVTEKQGTENLIREGHPREHIHFVGHVMIDNLRYQAGKLAAMQLPMSNGLKKRLPSKYAALTMHRPSNVDERETLTRLLHCLAALARQMPIVFPCHPRTRKRIEEFGLEGTVNDQSAIANWQLPITTGIILLDPLGYMDFLNIWKDSTVVLTDSGGLQEETTALRVPCITMRETTERPVTAEIGSNVVVGRDTDRITEEFNRAVSGQWKESAIPDLWDGKASERIVDVLCAVGPLR